MEEKYKTYIIIFIVSFLVGVLLACFFLYYGFLGVVQDIDSTYGDKCTLTCFEAGLLPEFCWDFCDDFEVNWTKFEVKNQSEVKK